MKVGNKVKYQAFNGKIKQFLGDEEAVVLLNTPTEDGAMTVVAKVSDLRADLKGYPKKPKGGKKGK